MPLPTKDERVEIRVPTPDLRLWRAAAERERMTLSDWIRRQCHRAVDGAAATKKKGRR